VGLTVAADFVAVGSAVEVSVAVGFEGDPDFAEEALAVVFVAAFVVTASGVASVFADADGGGEAAAVGTGVGA